MSRFLTALVTILSIISCKEQPKIPSDPLQAALIGAPTFVNDMIDSSQYEIQIIYTQIERDQKGHPYLTSFYINRDDDKYFYPASTVKMPVAFLALQRINELKELNPAIDKSSRLSFGSSHPPQSPEVIDSSSSSGYPQVQHYIEQIFSVSDNNAYNRLYEFLGQDYINEELRNKGIFRNSRIRTRVGISGFDTDANRFTNPVNILGEDGSLLYEQEGFEAIYNRFVELNDTDKGIGYYDDELDTVVYESFDMHEKNFINLTDLEASLQRVIFPDLFSPDERFNLTSADYDFLYSVMPKTPLDFDFHQDQADEYYDSYVKFFYNGDSKEHIPDYIEIYNKVGWAYGTLTDCSYIKDLKNNIDFFLTATVLVNENQIFNDGVYEYESKGLPFLSALGKTIYNYELSKNK